MGRFSFFPVSAVIVIIFLFSLQDAGAGDDMAMLMPQKPSFMLFPYQIPPLRVVPSAGSEYPRLDPEAVLPRSEALVAWMNANVSPRTGLFLSFQVLPEEKKDIYGAMGDAAALPGIVERTIVEDGLDIYDGAVGQIALTAAGGDDNFERARHHLDIYWKGRFEDIVSIRAGYPNYNFVYDPQDPEAVTSLLTAEGRRGFIFRIINAHGNYLVRDPLDGKERIPGTSDSAERLHWEDWKPVAGENAWIAMAAMQLYHKKYYDAGQDVYRAPDRSVELLLAEELARAAMVLQSEIGGIRMAPIGTFRENEFFAASSQGSWWYNQISTENNLSWYSALRMLYRVTNKDIYLQAMSRMEIFFKQVYDPVSHTFYQGMACKDGQWVVNKADFAVDVQTWGILSLGADTIDAWFGDGAAYALWDKAREYSGTYNEQGQLTGVGYTKEQGRVSVEWSAGAIMAARELAVLYCDSRPDLARSAEQDAAQMRAGMELLRRDFPGGVSAYAYSSKRGWIPFGWNSHDRRVMSLASTGWMFFVDKKYNPFRLDGKG
ncbi:MAG: hypothetical protein WCI27_05100 [Candidatus Omnitrophota bacterium]